MLSNKQTKSSVHQYEQFPMANSVYNKKIQKHLPQRLDIVGNSSEFTVDAKLLELLPDDCMVGLECCFMNDGVGSIVKAQETLYTGLDTAISLLPPICISQTQLIPSTILTVTPDNQVQIRNLFNGGRTQPLTNGVIQTQQYYESTDINTIIGPKVVVAEYIWTFDGFKFDSVNNGYGLVLNLGLSSQSINSSAIDIGFEMYLVPNTDLVVPNFQVLSVITLLDTSQSIIIQTTESFVPIYHVGDIISFTDVYGLYFQIEEVINSTTLRIKLGYQNVQDFASPISSTLPAHFSVTPYNTVVTDNEDIKTTTIAPGNQIKILQTNDNSIIYVYPDDTQANSAVQGTSSYYACWQTNVDCDLRVRLKVNSFSSTTVTGFYPTNINIESPLFTDARVYDTNTKQYSSTISSLPINSSGIVSYKEPVNNRNCSMYQINKNILNNFEIPFRITQDDGTQLYNIQNPDSFYIRFTLWFYGQTDDERYYYLPSL